MNTLKHLIVLLCISLLVVLGACVRTPLATSPTTTPKVSEETIFPLLIPGRLAAYEGSSQVHIEVGNRVEITIGITTGKNHYGCGKPSIRDSFGNTIVYLSPVKEDPGTAALYKYSFYAAAEGAYSVYFDYGNCSVSVIRGTYPKAEVKWVVHED